MLDNAFFKEDDLSYFAGLRTKFPIFSKFSDLAYLDSAATTQKPSKVIDALATFYREAYATVHRGVYALSQEATERCDAVRRQIRTFLNANVDEEIIFVRGSTEAINLVSATLPACFASDKTEILVTAMEHHANLVPWQQACERFGLTLKVLPIKKNGELDLSQLSNYLTEKTALFSLCHASNILATVNPLKYLIEEAKKVGAYVFIDGAQGPSHFSVDVQALDCDFYCFSGHKIFATTGIGVLYGKHDILEKMPPFQTGGAMIDRVTFSKTSFAHSPAKFEAGTPAIGEIIGLGAALDFVAELDFSRVHRYEQALLQYTQNKMNESFVYDHYGEADERISILSFNLNDIHPHDAGTVLDMENIALRAGHHCSQPLMDFYDVSAMLRVSFSIYNLPSDIDQLLFGLKKCEDLLK